MRKHITIVVQHEASLVEVRTYNEMQGVLVMPTCTTGQQPIGLAEVEGGGAKHKLGRSRQMGTINTHKLFGQASLRLLRRLKVALHILWLDIRNTKTLLANRHMAWLIRLGYSL
ncbi:16e55eda-664f-4688-9bdb-ea149b2628ff [Sclerotinia trifoliorum]|uniref:16e55eda-664f-4688-9bdb-ea149b2628ff n=1 Tax=Sclerotinia trifoliorum TaxID=28548 RepID=A0A8H2W155_9HELO|nr:16e55eda-664f-4688-9bdb-ea149b2628ff [Sclerotinia trifoliorum]